MAPSCPEEVDVFTIPHSRMKELVQNYLDLLTDTNFSDVIHLKTLLENLGHTFQEFRNHEQIENQFIMRKLQDKLKRLSIKNKAVCNCHSDNRLMEILDLLKDGYKCTEKTDMDRINYGIKLRKTLEEFTEQFIPHMEEEEEVFQPMLMQYFSFEELCEIKNKVIKHHLLCGKQKEAEQVLKKEQEYDVHEKEITESTEKESQEFTVQSLPEEIMLEIFSYLDPKDLCHCAQVSHQWNELALDGTLWKTILPTQWSQGQWSFRSVMDKDAEEDLVNVNDQLMIEGSSVFAEEMDEDADRDESCSSDDGSDDDEDVKQIKSEAKMLTAIVRFLLPRVGQQVKTINLAYSKGLVNGLLYKILSQCPNLEVLDLSQTRVSDIAFKGFGKKGCGRKLKHLDLSGCVQITDTTLQRLSLSLGHLSSVSRQDLSHSEESNMEKNEIELSEKNCEKKCVNCKKTEEVFSESAPKNSVSGLLEIRDNTKGYQGMKPDSSDYVADKPVKQFQSNVETFDIEEVKPVVETNGGVKLDKNCRAKINPPDKIGISVISCAIQDTSNLRQNTVQSPSSNILTVNACHSRTNKLSKDTDFTAESQNHLQMNSNDQTLKKDKSKVEALHGDKTQTYYESKKPKRTSDSQNPQSHCANSNVCDMTSVVSPSRGLEYLSLSGCYHVTDDGLRHLTTGGGLPKLQHLDLSGCLNITVDGLTELISVCPGLDWSNLYYCDNVLDGPYAELANGCQNLECNSRVCCRTGY